MKPSSSPQTVGGSRAFDLVWYGALIPLLVGINVAVGAGSGHLGWAAGLTVQAFLLLMTRKTDR